VKTFEMPLLKIKGLRGYLSPNCESWVRNKSALEGTKIVPGSSRALCLTRLSHQLSTAADPGMSAALRSLPVCAASLRNLVRNAG